MIESGEDERFPAEAPSGTFVGEPAWMQDLQSDIALETLIARPVDDPHPTGADLLENTVVRERLAFHRPDSLDLTWPEGPQLKGLSRTLSHGHQGGRGDGRSLMREGGAVLRAPGRGPASSGIHSPRRRKSDSSAISFVLKSHLGSSPSPGTMAFSVVAPVQPSRGKPKTGPEEGTRSSRRSPDRRWT